MSSNNKIIDELITTVGSIVGSDYTKMDIIRALHLSNNDPTSAINIIFDTPGFKTPKTPNPLPPPVTITPRARPKARPEAKAEKVSCSENGDVNVKGRIGGGGDEWWFVGCCEVVGLSTCKGRNRIGSGERVEFTFPVEK